MQIAKKRSFLNKSKSEWNSNYTKIVYVDGSSAIKNLKGETSFNSITERPTQSTADSTVKEIYFGKNVQIIGQYTCQQFRRLEKVYFPNTIVQLKYSAFSGCQRLHTVNFPDSLLDIGSSTSRECVFWSDDIPNVGIVGNVIFGKNTRLIGGECFLRNSRITLVKIPKSMRNIGYSAFWRCTSLSAVDMTSFDSTDTVPAITGSGSFDNNAPNRKFYFKNQETLNVFKSKSYWSNYQSYFVVGNP